MVAEKAIWSAVNASRALAPALHAVDVNATALRLQLKQLSIRAQAARAGEARARWWLRRGYRGVYVLVEQIRQNSEVDSAERRDGASCKGGGAGRADPLTGDAAGRTAGINRFDNGILGDRQGTLQKHQIGPRIFKAAFA